MEDDETVSVEVGTFEYCGFAAFCKENGQLIKFKGLTLPNTQVCANPSYNECSDGKASLTFRVVYLRTVFS